MPTSRPPEVQATARIAVEARPGGGNRFVTLTGTGPLTPRRTADERVHLVAGAGGPLGGDDYTLDISVGAGARLSVCSAAASIVLAAEAGRPSRLTVRARVEAGGELRLTPQAVVLTRRGRHECVTDFDVADGARLLARELLVLGRSGEQGGHGIFRTRLDVAGRPVLRQTVRFDGGGGDGDGEGRHGPAVLAGGRALGQILLAGAADVPSGVRGTRGAWMPSAEPGCGVFTVTDPDPLVVSRRLDRETEALDGVPVAA